MKFKWVADETSAGFRCDIGNFTLVAVPDRTVCRKFKNKPVRGTKWRAQCSHSDWASHTISRYGRDCYGDLQPTAKDAKALAEQVFIEAQATN